MKDNVPGIDSSQAVDLGSPAPDGAIDLTKPLSEAQFRTALVALTNNSNEGIAQILFHIQHGMQALVQLTMKNNQLLGEIMAHISQMAVVDLEVGNDSEDDE